MGALDRLFHYYQQFHRLPFLARRAVLFLFFVGCFVAGVKIGPFSQDLGFLLLVTAWFGLVWSTGLWTLWRPLLIVLAIFLRIFY